MSSTDLFANMEPKSQSNVSINDLDEESLKRYIVQEIQKIMIEKKIDALTAAIEFAKQIEWDPAWLAPYITGTLKEEIRIEGERQGLLKKSSNPKILFE